MMFQQTISLYNRRKEADAEYWVRTVLHHVQLVLQEGGQFKASGVASSRKYGRVSDQTSSLLIPARSGYLSPEQWQQSTDDEGWTLQPGDFIVPSTETPQKITGLSELQGNSGIRVISTAVFYPEGGLAHWEVKLK